VAESALPVLASGGGYWPVCTHPPESSQEAEGDACRGYEGAGMKLLIAAIIITYLILAALLFWPEPMDPSIWNQYAMTRIGGH